MNVNLICVGAIFQDTNDEHELEATIAFASNQYSSTDNYDFGDMLLFYWSLKILAHNFIN